MWNSLKEKFNALLEIEGWRMALFLLASAVLLVVVMTVARHLAAVTMYKIALVAFGGWMGFWLDIMLFPGSRPSKINNEFLPASWPLVFVGAQIRRAIIVFGVLIAISLAA